MLSNPITNSRSRHVHTWAYYRLLTAEAYGTTSIWSSSYWFLGHWKSPYLPTLIVGAGDALHLCILNFLRTFYMYVFCDYPNTSFLLSRWISMPKTNEASPRSFKSNFEDKNFFVSTSRLISLLASKISSTYRIRKTYFPFLNFAYTQLSSMFSLNLKFLLFYQTSSTAILKLASTHKLISLGDISFILYLQWQNL